MYGLVERKFAVLWLWLAVSAAVVWWGGWVGGYFDSLTEVIARFTG